MCIGDENIDIGRRTPSIKKIIKRNDEKKRRKERKR